MTHSQAIAVRTLALQGIPMDSKVLNEAIAIIKNTKTVTPWPMKDHTRDTPERQPGPGQQWKNGDEFLPFHPQASHVPADYRDGWNRCYWMAAKRSAA